MKTQTALLNLLLTSATLWLTGCSTPGSSSAKPVTRATQSDSPSIPQHLAPLGRIRITTFQADSALLVRLPLVRGEAIKERSSEGAQAFIGAPIPAGNTPNVPYASGAAIVGLGGLEFVGVALAPVNASIKGLRAMLNGIPASKYYPAMHALTNAQAQYQVTEAVIHRIHSQAQQTGRSDLDFFSNGKSTAGETILELYEGERSLRGNGQVNPPMQFRLGFKCSLIRPSDHKVLHVFRVAYASEHRSFVQWGANGAALFREEVEMGMASVTEQIVAQLAAIEAVASRTQPSAGIQQASVPAK